MHVGLDACDVALVVDSEIESASCGGIEECANALHHIDILGVFVWLHIVVGGEDYGGLELQCTTLHT